MAQVWPWWVSLDTGPCHIRQAPGANSTAAHAPPNTARQNTPQVRKV
eukprot:CAMPEP_0172788498 /NCGR_PEP_ID=MMETSP1074-20121228/206984_1 /TAXON_ID=2916 /ORGANISM="Ceratium fusus, Strain PA161109" /LENGTH=46 /DNA_ID= /DNA_START= /DNA_END= /DNA_ORIENTATION=